MFGRKKEERGAGPKDGRSGAESQQGYYRQEDYYTQRPSGGSYYDVNSYDGGRRERREYARPEYDRRYVNTQDGSTRRTYDGGRPPQDPSARGEYGSRGRGSAPQGYDPMQMQPRRMSSGRGNVPYMEEGYGERIYDPAAYPDRGRSRRRENGPERRYGQDRPVPGAARENRRREERYRETGYRERGYREEMYRPGRRRRKKHTALKVILGLFLVLLLGIGVFVFSRLGMIGRTRLDDLLFNSGIGSMDGYTNIALYGVDSRTGELTRDCHSDTIMILSLNRRSKEIKIASVYRDTYLDNTNGEYRKATECYFYGGPERSVNMLNKNLDLNIKDYVAVNFNAVVKVIDLLGGIDLEITDEEMGYINGYCVENKQVLQQTIGENYDYSELQSAGNVHLNGLQALAYCRIRYTQGWDLKRTERQRTVLTLLWQKAVKQGPGTMLSVANTMLPQISTSMGNMELIGLIAGVRGYKVGEQTGFPFDMMPADLAAGDCIVPVNLAANVTKLHGFLFGESDYVPSSTVQEISNEIINATGIA